MVGLGAWLWHVADSEPTLGELERRAATVVSEIASWEGAVLLDLTEMTELGRTNELFHPATALPRWHRLVSWEARGIRHLGRECSYPEEAPRTQVGLKAAAWHALNCGLIPKLDPDFFERPPLMHPSGSSYVALAFQSRRPEFGRSWLKVHAGRLHALEYQLLAAPTPARRAIAELTPRALEALLSRQPAVVDSEWVLLRQRSASGVGTMTYAAIARDRVEARAMELGLATTAGHRHCVVEVDGLCWQRQVRDPAVVVAVGGAMASGAVVVIGLLALGIGRARALRDERRARERIVRTLTHELRTPATSLSLSMDVLSEDYDKLPPGAQDGFLRMAGQVSRLNRVIALSERYLTSGSKDRFRRVQIPCAAELLQSVLAEYDGRIEARLPPVGQPLSTDPHWLAVCVRNLCSNAIEHGAAPVMLDASLVENVLTVVVTDGGDLDGVALEELCGAFHRGDESRGLGLGLQIVAETVADLGGTLELTTRPTRFEMRVSA